MDDSTHLSTFSSVVAATNSNLTRLSRTMTTTATMLASPYGDLGSKAMSELTGPQFHRRLFSFGTGRHTPSEMVKESFSTRVARFRALTDLPEELLRNVPPPKSKYSLFQGFEAQHSTHPTQDLCSIQKELATGELVDLDRQIAELQEVRRIVFNRVARVEKQERNIQASQPSDPTPTTPKSLEHRSSGSSAKMPASPKRFVPTLQQFYNTGDRIRTFKTGTEPVRAVDFDVPFGTLVAATGAHLQVWDLGDEAVPPHVLVGGGPENTIESLYMSDSMTVCGRYDGVVSLWDVRRAVAGQDQVPASFVGHIGPVTAVHLDPQNASVVSGSSDCTIRHWDVPTGKCVQTIDVLSCCRPSVESPPRDGGSSRSASNEVVPAAKGPAVGALQHFDAALASGTADGTVRLWDLRAGRVVRELSGGHLGPVTCLHFDGMQLVSGAADGSVRIWDLRSGSVVDALHYDSAVTAVNFDAAKVVTGIAGDGAVRVYDRAKRVHWVCGQSDASLSTLKYELGYLVEGRSDGSIGVWAC